MPQYKLEKACEVYLQYKDNLKRCISYTGLQTYSKGFGHIRTEILCQHY